VPVNVDAIVFWHVRDARKASLEQAIDRVAQTSHDVVFRFAHDSPLEKPVTSELVSEAQIPC
jgi:hypothetical protein